jgi:hypothetical protein
VGSSMNSTRGDVIRATPMLVRLHCSTHHSRQHESPQPPVHTSNLIWQDASMTNGVHAMQSPPQRPASLV